MSCGEGCRTKATFPGAGRERRKDNGSGSKLPHFCGQGETGRERGCWKPPAAGLTQLLPIPAMGTFADKLPREDKSARGLRVRALQNSNNAKNNVINP